MSSSSAHLRQIGIYRNLPTFDESVRGLTAIITGANGISGFNTMRALLDSPERWKTIYCLSRRPPPEDMMAVLPHEAHPGSKLLHWSEADALVESNTALLKNFLEALEMADIKPARFILQTGGKNYGTHIGRARTPQLESDPQPRHLAPNFYYPQEDLLKTFCEKNGASWNVIRPAAIIGASTHGAMNMFYLFAVYAAVQARKGEPLFFGGDWEQWQYEYYHCSARMTGYLTEWAALEKHCGNEAFNTSNGGPLTYERFFIELARWFGAKGVIPPPDDDSKMVTIEMGCGGKESPLGYGPPMLAKSSFSFLDWAKIEENAATWRDIMQESGGKITSNPFDDLESFSTLKWAYHRFGSVCVNKARRFGWTGFVDTMESIFEMYQEMGEFGTLPPMQVEFARPLC